MMSINQMNIYHTILEAYNVVRKSSSEKIQMKWARKPEHNYFLRSENQCIQTVPEKPMKKCLGFTYTGSKLFNKLPCNLKEVTNTNTFKSLLNSWVWKNIPSY